MSDKDLIESGSATWDSSEYEFVFRDKQGNLVLPDKQEAESSAQPTSEAKKEVPKIFA